MISAYPWIYGYQAPFDFNLPRVLSTRRAQDEREGLEDRARGIDHPNHWAKTQAREHIILL